MVFNSSDDERFPFNRFGFLMPYRCKIAVSQLLQRDPSLRPINLAQFGLYCCKIAPCQCPVRGAEQAFDFLAVHLDASIINPVR